MKTYTIPLLVAIALLGAGCSSSSQVQVNTNTQPQPSMDQPKMDDGTAMKNDDSMKMDDTVDAHAEDKADVKVNVGGTKVDVGADTKADVAIKTHSVSIQNFAYSQPSLKVKKGDKIIFTNKDSVQHTVTADGDAFGSGMLSTNVSFTVDTSKLAPGSYPYHCEPHPMMKGTLIVE